jgi:hypothetical protein
VFPAIADIGKNGCEGNDLSLIGQIKDAVNLEHVQKLRRLHKAPLHFRLVPLDSSSGRFNSACRLPETPLFARFLKDTRAEGFTHVKTGVRT